MKDEHNLTPGQSILAGIVSFSFSIWLIIIPPLAVILVMVGIFFILNGIIGAINNKIEQRKKSSQSDEK